MRQYKKAKIYFCFAVLLLVAKPFLGFTMFTRNHPPSVESIFIKAFTKRKQEYAEDSNGNMETVHKKLAQPLNFLFLRFSYFLNILFPLKFVGELCGNNYLRNYLDIRSLCSAHRYLANAALLI